MSDDQSDAQDRTVSEDAARNVIERALRLEEQRTGEVSVRHLRSALAELGVSDAVFRAAMTEAETPADAGRFTPLPVLHATTVGVGLGAAGAVFSALIRGGAPISFIMAGGIFMISGVLAVRNRPGASTWRYQAANAGLWLGCGITYRLIAGWAATHHMGPSMVFYSMPFLIGWAFTAIVGSTLANYRGDDAGQGARVEGIGTRLRRSLARAIRRVPDLVDPQLRARHGQAM